MVLFYIYGSVFVILIELKNTNTYYKWKNTRYFNIKLYTIYMKNVNIILYIVNYFNFVYINRLII